jgi:hypothetical protein
MKQRADIGKPLQEIPSARSIGKATLHLFALAQLGNDPFLHTLCRRVAHGPARPGSQIRGAPISAADNLPVISSIEDDASNRITKPYCCAAAGFDA